MLNVSVKIWASLHRLHLACANNEDPDKTEHPCSLVKAFTEDFCVNSNGPNESAHLVNAHDMVLTGFARND